MRASTIDTGERHEVADRCSARRAAFRACRGAKENLQLWRPVPGPSLRRTLDGAAGEAAGPETGELERCPGRQKADPLRELPAPDRRAARPRERREKRPGYEGHRHPAWAARSRDEG